MNIRDNHLYKAVFCGSLLFCVILACFVAYWNALDNGVIWDDHHILESQAIKGIGLSNLIGFFTDKDVYHAPGEIYRPLYLLSFAIDYKLYSTSPWGYHLTNIILHALVGIISFIIAAMVLNHYLSAFFVALLFAVHPIHTESVTWIKGRDDVMAMLFFLLALYFYVISRPAGINYLLSLLFYIFALLSKEIAITFPLILILHDICFSTERIRGVRYWFIYLPFFFIGGVYFIVRTIVLGQVAQTEYMGGSFGPTMFTMAKVMVLYIKLLMFPLNLCGDYLGFPISMGIDYEVVYSFFILAGIVITGIISYRYCRSVAFVIFWFFITLLPASNIIPIKILIAERFLYIPSFGFALLCGIGAKKIIKGRISNNFKSAVIVVFLIAILLYTYGTIERNKVWKDEFSFWADVIDKYPTARAYTNYGLAFEETGKIDEAIGYYEKALSLDPRFAYALNNLAVAYIKNGHLDEAIIKFKEALAVDPNDPQIHINLGDAYKKKQLIQDALIEYQIALRIKPDLLDAGSRLAQIYMEIGMVSEATELLLNSTSPRDTSK